jgi:hypothetical protein
MFKTPALGGDSEYDTFKTLAGETFRGMLSPLRESELGLILLGGPAIGLSGLAMRVG